MTAKTIAFFILLGLGMLAAAKNDKVKPEKQKNGNGYGNGNIKDLEDLKKKSYDLNCTNDREELLHICEKYPKLRSCANHANSNRMPMKDDCQNLRNLTKWHSPDGSHGNGKKVSKRSANQGTNLCTGDTYTEKVLFYAEDEDQNEVELVQYPAENLFHTYYTRECGGPNVIPPDWACRMQNMKIDAMIFDDYNNDPDLKGLPIKAPIVIPVICSLTPL